MSLLYYLPNVLVEKIVKETTVAEAVNKLEALTLTSRSTISPLQENTIYKKIIETRQEDIVLRYLDLRRTSTKMQDINAQMQAEAIVKLHEYRNTVYQNQAKMILDKIMDTNFPTLQKLMLVVKESDTIAGKFNYFTERLATIEAKLTKLRVINEL